MSKNKKKNNHAQNSYKTINLRIYDQEQIDKINEFKRLLRIENRTNNKRVSINQKLSNVILDYIDGKVCENSDQVISKMLLPIFKKALKKQFEEFVEIVMYKFKNLEEQINMNFDYIHRIGIYNANVLSTFDEKSNLLSEFWNENSNMFKKPKWFKLDK